MFFEGRINFRLFLFSKHAVPGTQLGKLEIKIKFLKDPSNHVYSEPKLQKLEAHLLHTTGEEGSV